MDRTADARVALFSVIGRQHDQSPPLMRSQYPAGQVAAAPSPPTRNPFNAKGRTIYSADAHTTSKQRPPRHSPYGHSQGTNKHPFSIPATPPRGSSGTESEPSSSPSPSDPGVWSEEEQEMFDMYMNLDACDA
ncbi:hypothetical protein BDN71DRAFT_779600 [Pleurotus eryngii]|uniref:Uncharacterized protein n=1 Tax=Pleurotus eryngii TaxID=5323 RepID=A0A9P6A1F2_PLEER|nr:hypothetical protein BDN71DRAFT_779600 [Pleurotus eryngii]